MVALLGWYACFTIMCAEMRVQISLPLGDLSRFWPRTDVEITAAARDHHD